MYSSEEDFAVKRGDRIAQLILERISMADVIEVDELTSTERGAAGFGSTGVNAATAVAEAELKRQRIEDNKSD